jgi:hypothetical protein
MARQELKDREVGQYEFGNEARKRKLLVALLDKIAEKQTRGKCGGAAMLSHRIARLRFFYKPLAQSLCASSYNDLVDD